MALVIPVFESSPTFDGQSVADAADLQAWLAAIQDTGVASGMTVSQHTGSDMAINTASGVVSVLGVPTSVSAATGVTVGAASSTDRRDIVVWTSGGTGVHVVAGTPCGTAGWTHTSTGNPPVKPSIPANSILLGEIYVANNTSAIVAGNLIDKTTSLGALVPSGSNPGDLLAWSTTSGAYLTGPIVVGSYTQAGAPMAGTNPGKFIWVTDYQGGSFWYDQPGGGGYLKLPAQQMQGLVSITTTGDTLASLPTSGVGSPAHNIAINAGTNVTVSGQLDTTQDALVYTISASGSGGGGSSVLGSAESTTNTSLTLTTSAQAATNGPTITFTAPASQTVMVMVSCSTSLTAAAGGGCQTFVQINETSPGSTVLGNAHQMLKESASASALNVRVTTWFRITSGLTSTTSYTIQPEFYYTGTAPTNAAVTADPIDFMVLSA